ncbi:MAG: CotH kinase family protein, partial [Candidatus Hodarchaeota archaeon]
NFSSNLPIIIINTYGQSIPDEPKIIADLIIIYNESGGRNSISDSPVNYSIYNFSGTIGIEIRGFTSQIHYPKKQYGFETRHKDDPDEDVDVPLLGFPAEEDWVLHAPYPDKTLMRNFIAYNLSNQIGRYASRTKFVELFLNKSGASLESQYQGVYVLMEKIKRNEYRVNITKLLESDTNPPNITGGYILKIDNLSPDDGYFYTNMGTRLIYVYPNSEDMEDRPVQRDWIKNYINEFETALYGPNFTDPIEGYAKYIDVDSFIDHFLITEFLKNVAGYTTSTYLYKDRGGKLVMGPIWDFNIAMGNGDHYVEDWVIRYKSCWFSRLLKDDNFVSNVTSRWNGLRTTVFNTQYVFSLIDNTSSLLNESQKRNFQKWPILGRWIWTNTPPDYPDTYEGEIKNLKEWFEDRLIFIDNHINEIGNLKPVFRFPSGLLFFIPQQNNIIWHMTFITGMVLAGIATLYISIKTNPKIITDSNSKEKNYKKRKNGIKILI